MKLLAVEMQCTKDCVKKAKEVQTTNFTQVNDSKEEEFVGRYLKSILRTRHMK